MDVFLALRLAYLAVLLAVCAFAIARGGRDERLGAIYMLVGSVASAAVQLPPFFDWRFAREGLLAVDVALLFAMLRLALRSDRFWPLWATAFHLIAVTTHLVMLVQPDRVLQAYAIAQGFWAYPMLISILVGTVAAGRKARPRKG